LRHGGFRVFFFSGEEMRKRMHAHVAHADGEGRFWLEPRVELALNQGLARIQINEALSLMGDHYEEKVHAWRDHSRN
jgi:hypothetical protein